MGYLVKQDLHPLINANGVKVEREVAKDGIFMSKKIYIPL